MVSPFKTHSNPIQNPWGTHSKSMGSPFKRHRKTCQNHRGRPKFYSFKLSIVGRPNTLQTEICSPTPFARPLGYRCPSRAFESGSLCAQEERLCGSPGGSRGPHWGNPCQLPPRRGKRSALPKGDVPSRAAVEELAQPTGRLPPLKF